MDEWQTTFESLCVEPGLPQSYNLTTRTRRCNQDARSPSKIAAQQWQFPVKEAAQVVLTRCIVLRFVEVLRCNGVKVVGTQATEPNALMQCCHQPDEAVEPAIRVLKTLRSEFSGSKHLIQNGFSLVAETLMPELSEED